MIYAQNYLKSDMEIAEDVHLIKCPFSRYFTSVCALLGDEIVLVDSGMPSSPDEAIIPYLEGLGRRPDEVAYVILTHGHFDHCGGAYSLKKRFSARIVAHELDRPFLEDALLLDRQLYNRFGGPPIPGEATFPSAEVDITVKDGDSLYVSGRDYTFLHLPGHSPGSMAVVDRAKGFYVVGDSPQGRGSGRPLLFHDAKEYEASMLRLASEPIGTLVLGHPFPPLEKPVLEDGEARLHAEESLTAIRELVSNVQGALCEVKKPRTLEEIQARLPGVQRITLGCVLEALTREGKAMTRKVDGRPMWQQAV